MTSWFDKGRPALFEALNTICQQIDQDLLAELQQKAKDSVSNSKSEEEGDFVVSTASVKPSSQEKDWKAEYAKLSARYNALSSNFKKARDALQKRRDERDRWIEHAALLERRIKAAEDEHGIPILDRSTRQSGASNHLESEATRPAEDASFSSDGGIDHADAPDTTLPPLPPTTTLVPAAEPAQERQSDSTQGESEGRPEESLPALRQNQGHDDVKIKEEPSSEGAVFVSERCLKKRKRDDEGSTVARAVKTEPGQHSSSPEMSLHHCDFNPHESLDLGDVGQMMFTPRKRRELEQAEQGAQRQQNATPGQQADAPSTAQPSRWASALTPMNTSLPAPTWSAPPVANKPPSKGLDRGIATLAEDGGVYKKATPSMVVNINGIKPSVRGRLDALLNSPSLRDESVTLKRVGRRPQEVPTTPRDDLGIPKPRELPFEKNARQNMRTSNGTTPQTPRTPLTDVTNNAQRAKPTPVYKKSYGSVLRNKPLSELRLEDFKVNPRTNDGHDFAFSEVVRDKSERACLPGCVDMHCCGKKFRSLALSQRPDPPLTAAQRQEEQKLLEEYLGDHSYRLASMDREERTELWIEAKTRELADKYGNHRHRFSRMQSPPGFWNADFPSTQEIEAERAEAAKREKQTLQERHREAMRPGGRWIFRDE